GGGRSRGEGGGENGAKNRAPQLGPVVGVPSQLKVTYMRLVYSRHSFLAALEESFGVVIPAVPRTLKEAELSFLRKDQLDKPPHTEREGQGKLGGDTPGSHLRRLDNLPRFVTRLRTCGTYGSVVLVPPPPPGGGGGEGDKPSLGKELELKPVIEVITCNDSIASLVRRPLGELEGKSLCSLARLRMDHPGATGGAGWRRSRASGVQHEAATVGLEGEVQGKDIKSGPGDAGTGAGTTSAPELGEEPPGGQQGQRRGHGERAKRVSRE
ncbi:unnamed protein product, partial [Discosporangium mesarthrocarpum]